MVCRNNRCGQEMRHDGNEFICLRAPAAGPTWVGKRRRRRVDGMLVIDFENPGRHVSRPSDAEVALEYATYVDVNPPKRGSWDGPAKVETQTAAHSRDGLDAV